MEFDGKRYFNTKTLKERWQCSNNTIYNYVRNGFIPFIRTPGGRIFLFPIDGILEYEAKQYPKKSKIRYSPVKKNCKALSAPKKIWRAEL